jgi:fatty acid-binding protein DegV
MRDNIDSAQPLHVGVTHSEQPEEAEELSKQIKEQFHPVELYLMHISPISQITVGSGILGIAFYQGD